MHKIALLMAGIRDCAANRDREAPMDTVSAYVPMRFCSSCCAEWGSMDVWLDILAREENRKQPNGRIIPREVIYAEWRQRLAPEMKPCCTRALYPGQCNIEVTEKMTIVEASSVLPHGIPTVLSIMPGRPRLRCGMTDAESRALAPPPVLYGRRSLAQLNELLS